MTVRRALVLLAVAAALLLPLSARAAGGTPTPVTDSATPGATPTTGPGTITGTVKNGTPKGGSVAGIPVKLDLYAGTTLIQTYNTTTAQDGTYGFKDLPVVSGEGYIATATFKNVPYQSDLVQLTQDEHSTADISVYEPTTDPKSISIVARGMVIAGVEQGSPLLDVFEIVSVDNTTDHAYIGANNVVLQVPLPEGATQIIPQPGFNFGDVSVQNGQLITTGAIAPGNQDAMFAYLVPYSGTSITLKVGSTMPTASFSVLVQQGTYSISSPAMHDGGTANISDIEYHVITADHPVVGDVVAVSVGGLPRNGGSPDSTRGPLYAGLAAALGLLAAGGLVFQTVRRRRLAASAAGSALVDTPTGPEEQRLNLASELNQLDEERAAGNIDEETYRRDREEILEELRAISRRLHGIEDAGV